MGSFPKTLTGPKTRTSSRGSEKNMTKNAANARLKDVVHIYYNIPE